MFIYWWNRPHRFKLSGAKLNSSLNKFSPNGFRIIFVGQELGRPSYDLLPIPYTEEAVANIAERLDQVQNFLERPLILENVSSYFEYKDSEMKEWEFVAAIAKSTGCGLLVDLNNIYVSSQNHDYDPYKYLDALPWEQVAQIHLAGFSEQEHLLVDTHSAPVADAVWPLVKYVNNIKGPISTMVEWDSEIPELSVLEDELEKVIQLGGYDARS